MALEAILRYYTASFCSQNLLMHQSTNTSRIGFCFKAQILEDVSFKAQVLALKVLVS